MTSIKWNGDTVLKETQKLAWQRVLAAGAYLKAEIQKNVSVSTEAEGKTSAPGEYPHIGYHPPIPGGTLRKSIFVRKREDMIAVDVGTKLIYGVHWELTNRPYIRRTYAEKLGEIKAILQGKLVRTIEDVREEAAAMKERHQVQKAAIQAKKQAARVAKQGKKAERRAEKKAYKTGVKQRQRVRKFETKEKRTALARTKRTEQRETARIARKATAEKRSTERQRTRERRAATAERKFTQSQRRKREK